MRHSSAFLCLLLFMSPHALLAQTPDLAAEERAIRSALAGFYEAWNAHDAKGMTAVYADDVDHINVFGQWHKGKAAIHNELERQHTTGFLKDSHKTFKIEKIRFLKPDVAVVQVRSLSKVGNIGTYVMTKQDGRWLTVSFTNVGYELPEPRAPGAPK